MFKGFQDTSRSPMFQGFPNLNFQMNNEAYGFSGCAFWLDAAYGLNTQTDLAAVSSWRDRIRGIEFVQATAGNQPRLNTANASYNNYPVIQFFDTARRLNSSTDDSKGLSIPSNFTIALVANYNTSNNANSVFSNGNSGASTLTAIVLGGSNAGVNGVAVYVNNSVQGSGTTESTTVKIGIITNTEIVVNGVQENTYSSYTFDKIITQVGGGRSQAVTSLNGNIAEILVFGNTLSSNDCIRLSDNINSKYALY